ncbi:TolC family protein [Aquimarina agarivorans]|uniref:TolC family protein n=1 Tax=Aquimarina agarivorans TaxID=980584 RepID=UPI000248ED14|nr:TolC family protein [Aquimarina agarivorans]
MKKLLITTFASVVFYGLGQAQKENTKTVWSIQDCMEYAIKNNLQIQQQQLDLQDADINKNDAKNAFLPDLNGSASNDWNFGFSRNINGVLSEQNTRSSSYSLNSNIPIYNGRQNYNRLQRAKLQKVANQYNIDRLKDDIRINIANSYLQILLQQENLNVLKAQNDITLEQIKRTQQLIDAGNLPEGDVLQLKATAAENLQNIANSENSVAIAKLGLKQILQLNFENAFEIEKIEIEFKELLILDQDVSQIVGTVLKNRNEIKLAEQNIKLAEKDITIAKGAFFPTISGNVNYNTGEITIQDTPTTVPFFDQLNNNKSFGFGARIDVPIFNRFRVKNNVGRNKVTMLRSQNQLEQAKQQLTQNVYQAYLDAKASDTSFEAAKVAVTAQERAFEYAKNRFEVGISNSLDFTQARIAYQNSQTQLLRAKYDLLFKVKLLELYYGNAIE